MAFDRISVNVRLLIGSLLALAAIGGLVHLLHAMQFKRNCAAILDMAHNAEEEGKSDRAMRFLGQYVQRVPTDTETMTHFGQLLEEQGNSAARRKARNVFEQVLIRDPDRADVRRRVALLAVQERDFDAAKPHLEILVNATPNDTELTFDLGLCYEARREYNSAATYYQVTRSSAPNHIASHARLARLLRGLLVQSKKNDKGEEEDAEGVINAMVDANPGDYRAFLARAKFHLDQPFDNPDAKAKAIQDARRDIAEALRVAPEEPTVWLAAADVAQMQDGSLTEARQYLRRLIEKYPGDAVVHQSLANLESQDGRPDEAMKVLREGLKKVKQPAGLLFSLTKLLIQKGNLLEAQQNIEQLEKMDFSGRERLEFLKAAKKNREGEWLEASRMLESIRPLFVGQADLLVQTDYLLADCYDNLGESDKRIPVLRRILGLDPLQQQARLYLAATLAKQSENQDDALAEYQRLVQLPNAPASAWMPMVQLLIARNLRLPKQQQQLGWERIDKSLAEFKKAFPDSLDAILVEARVLAARGEPDQARALLRNARKEKTKEVSLWLAEAGLEHDLGNTDIAEKLLAEAEKQLGDVLALRQARIVILVSRGREIGMAGLRILVEGAEKFKEEEQARLFTALGQAARELKELSTARQWWKRAAELQPKDMPIRLSLFELALEQNDEEGARAAVNEIQAVQGASRPLGSYTAARLDIWQASRGDKSHLEEARSLLAVVEKRRPNWSRLWLARAQIAELEGNPDGAILHYERAIDLGERDLTAVRRVLQLLYDKRRYAEADGVLRKLPEQVIAAAQFQKMATEFSIQQGNFAEALERARKAIPEDSTDYRDYIWLGQILWTAGNPSEAKIALRKATGFAPDKPDGWIALLQLLAQNKNPENAKEAEKVIDQAKLKIAKDQISLTLAQCYAIAGNSDKAREFYQAAIEEKPDDLTVLQSGAEFYLGSGQTAEAEKLLRSAVALANRPAAEIDRARRLLAIVLLAGADYQRKREAAVLLRKALDKQDASEAENVLDWRTLAVVLATFLGRPENEESAQILEKMEQLKVLTSEDRFLLAQIYDRLGKTQELSKCIQALVLDNPENARYLGFFVRVLLHQAEKLTDSARDKKLTEAEISLGILERLNPTDLGVVELQARRNKLRGEDVKAPLEKVKIKEPKAARDLALLCEQLEQYDLAERYFRQFASIAKEPRAALDLAAYLGRRKKLTEAFELCNKAWATCTPDEAAVASVRVVRATGANDEYLQRVQSRIEEALQTLPKEARVSLMVSLGSVAELRGKFDVAENLYRQVVNMDNRRADAMNNLAWVLIQQDRNPAEARDWADKAVTALGPIPELLDTRAVAYLAQKKPEEAIRDLTEALDRPALEPRLMALLQFHLALAQKTKGEADLARESLERSKKIAPTIEPLSPRDRVAYAKLAHDLGMTP